MPTGEKHGWNSIDHYQEIHYSCLERHPFVDHDRQDTTKFYYLEDPHFGLVVEISGKIYCRNNVIVDVEKYAEVQELRGGRLQMRCFWYRYNAHIADRHVVLRLDNRHDLDDYHCHVFDVETGEEIEVRPMTREELPTLAEFLLEVAEMMGEGAG